MFPKRMKPEQSYNRLSEHILEMRQIIDDILSRLVFSTNEAASIRPALVKSKKDKLCGCYFIRKTTLFSSALLLEMRQRRSVMLSVQITLKCWRESVALNHCHGKSLLATYTEIRLNWNVVSDKLCRNMHYTIICKVDQLFFLVERYSNYLLLDI